MTTAEQATLERGIWYGVNTGSPYSARIDADGERIRVQRLHPNTLEPVGSWSTCYPALFIRNYVRAR